jgi:hypothetical protein
MPTATVGQSVTGLGDPISASKEITDSRGTIVTETIPATSVDLPVPGFDADVSVLSMLAMLATGADLTVKTNSSGAPDDTISLADGVPLIYSGEPFETNPLTVDVTTGLFVSNADPTNDSVLDIRALEDSTP